MFWNLLIAVGAAVVACLLAQWLFKKDTEVEERRRAAIKTAAAYRNKGLTRVADFYENYAVGDYSGLVKNLKDAAVILSHDDALQGEFSVVFEKLLAEKLANPLTAVDVAKQAINAVAVSAPGAIADVAVTVAKLAPAAAAVATVL